MSANSLGVGMGEQTHSQPSIYVVISHVSLTLCAQLKVCLIIIFLIFGGVQK